MVIKNSESRIYNKSNFSDSSNKNGNTINTTSVLIFLENLRFIGMFKDASQTVCNRYFDVVVVEKKSPNSAKLCLRRFFRKTHVFDITVRFITLYDFKKMLFLKNLTHIFFFKLYNNVINSNRDKILRYSRI